VKRGLFVGLTTLDFIYLAAQPPGPNQKLVASDYTVSAGGPATNAAVAFQHLGNQAVLLSSVGNQAITQLIRADLQQCSIDLVDLTPDRPDPPPVSSIIVTEQTGERSVISINAVKTQATEVPTHCLQSVDIVLIDGHQMQVGQTISAQARAQGIPVVIDGGSWKPGFETVLVLTDYAICSANFHPPGCHSESDTIAFLTDLKIPHIAITHGEKPIFYQTVDGKGEIAVPQVQAIDTLGAGDIFHGAFCHAILQQEFPAALATAAQVAANSCRFFGTRRWLVEGRSGDRLLT
jgi:sugar/nucleoside kinase (ribokinase family)